MTDHQRPDGSTPITLFDLVLEPFVAPCRSLEWRIGQAYWHDRGVQAFVMQEVPNTVINDGVRARAAATVFLANCREAEAAGTLPDRIHIMELGSGLGLFARLFLDHVAELSAKGGLDYDQRLTFWVTDLSRKMLEDQRDLGLFDKYGDRVRLAVCDALTLGRPVPLDAAEPVEIPALQLILANYTFDLLPFTLLLRQDTQWFELRVQTRIRDTEFAHRICGLDREALLAAARAEDADRDPRLRAIAPVLDIERAYFPVDIDAIDPAGRLRAYIDEHLEPAIAANPGYQVRISWAHGALDALDASVAQLAPDGILLFNDFGTPTLQASLEAYGYRRFGTSTAVGLNFPLLDFAMARAGAAVAIADADDIAPVQSRLLSRRPLPATTEVYADAFDNGPLRHYHDLVDEARTAARDAEGSRADALYARAHEIAPWSWAILAEWATVVNQLLSDYPRGVDLARRALDINPFTSALAWNEYGDGLYNLAQKPAAHDAYLQATRVNPEHPRGWLNLAWTLAETDRIDDAIRAALRALELDRDDDHRDVLNTLIKELLERRADLRATANEWLAKRMS